MAGAYNVDMKLQRQRQQNAPSQLHKALTHGDLEDVQQLVNEHGWLVTNFDSKGNLPLHSAVKAGHANVVCYLTYANPGAVVESNLEHETPIYIAIIRNRFDLVKEILPLLEPTINLNQGQGKSIVHAVLMRPNWLENVGVLFEYDNRLMESRNYKGLSLLSWAIHHRSEQMAIDLATNYPTLMEVSDEDDSESSFPIHQALKASKLNVIRAFYNIDMTSIEKPNRLNQNILHLAAASSKLCKRDILTFLNSLPQVHQLLHMPDNYMYTPFMWAEEYDNTKFLRIFE